MGKNNNMREVPEPFAAEHSGVNANLPYTDFGYIPGIAQAAQVGVYVSPALNPQPYFSQAELNVANWFTTRVHLSPLGRIANNGEEKNY